VCVCVVVWGGVMKSWELFRGTPKGALSVVLVGQAERGARDN
jgi:hypothetical protein